MPRKKHIRLAEVPGMSRIIPASGFLRGKWRNGFFGNDNPLTVEPGCGKGEFILQMAEKFPARNFIGIDRRAARLWHGGNYLKNNVLKNVVFIHGKIENMKEMFADGEISEIRINFPDPYPKCRQGKKRMVSPEFLNTFKTLLIPDGKIFLKTDSVDLFNYTTETVRKLNGKILLKKEDFYDSNIRDELSRIQTGYEKRFLSEGRKIHYLAFCFTSAR